jgi:hypothetical protein
MSQPEQRHVVHHHLSRDHHHVHPRFTKGGSGVKTEVLGIGNQPNTAHAPRSYGRCQCRGGYGRWAPSRVGIEWRNVAALGLRNRSNTAHAPRSHGKGQCRGGHARWAPSRVGIKRRNVAALGLGNRGKYRNLHRRWSHAQLRYDLRRTDDYCRRRLRSSAFPAPD